MKADQIPSPTEPLRLGEWLKVIDKELRNVEFYSPTMPLSWQQYHAIIDRLIVEINKPEVGHGEGI